jgi:1-deoxy-D-xylulose-5-phosphate synthase
VELAIALHRTFRSPRDRILWDTGHQAYVHKILTGRWRDLDRIRQRGGLSGYPSRAESGHDVIENSHASTVLSYADGLAKGYQLQGIADRAVVAVIGDGALTGGMAWEALNNIAAAKDRPVVVVVNDNGRSYAPTIGGMANHLAALRTAQGYEPFLDWVKRVLAPVPALYDTLHGMKKFVKDVIAPQVLFEDLGLKYIGPVDGHDVGALEFALGRAANFGGPVVVHCMTRKGRGYRHAENDLADCFHTVRVMDPETGVAVRPPAPSWTSVFGDELVKLGQEREDIVGITAAMLEPTGLSAFAARFPDRVFDVGIAEQHAVTSAAGLAMAGMHPVVAVYSTFLSRGFDQVLMDVALHRCPVTFVLDRAGVTGEDGASHNGVWDLSLFQIVPGLRIAAPRDGATLRGLLREAVAADGPAMIRFPKGPVGPAIAAVGQSAGIDVLRKGVSDDVLLVSVGALAAVCLEAAERLSDQGIGVTVVDPRWIKPVNPMLGTLAGRFRLLATVEDNLRTGGFGAVLAQELRDMGIDTPMLTFGVPPRFLDHGTRAEVLAECGLTPRDIARKILERMSATAGRPARNGVIVKEDSR